MLNIFEMLVNIVNLVAMVNMKDLVVDMVNLVLDRVYNLISMIMMRLVEMDEKRT